MRTAPLVCLALALAACGGGGGHLEVTDPVGNGPTHKLVLKPGEAFEHVLPIRISGGLPPYESRLDDNCPDWVTLLPDQHTLVGTPPVENAGRTSFCTYHVTESDPGFRPQRSVSHGLRLEVGPLEASDLALPPPGTLNLSVGIFDSTELSPATGGVRPYAYSFTCAGGSLPSGMSFAPETLRFAGTPNVRFRDSCTYSVTDSSVPAAIVSQAVEVVVGGPVTGTLMLPEFVVPGNVLNLSVGIFDSTELSPATGGVRPYAYSFTCAGGSLPSGMSFAPETLRFAGTPNVRFRDSCTYSVTDSSVPAAIVSQAVEVVVGGPVTGTLMLPEFVVPGNVLNLSVGIFDSTELSPATGGVRPYAYSFTCAGGSLPSGMSFAPETLRFAGTPNVRFRDSCTYSVTDSSVPAAIVSQAVEVVVGGPVTGTLMLPEFVVPGNVLRLRVNERARVRFLMARGGVPPYTHGLHCSQHPPAQSPGPITLPPDFPTTVLPPGLGFDGLTQVLSGTPGDSYGGPDCTYWVTDSATPPATLARSVALIIDPARAKWRFTTRSLLQEDQPLNRDNEADADPQEVFTLPAAIPESGSSGGVPVYRLEVSPPLTFNSDPDELMLGYVHRGSDPPLGRTFTYRYQVLFGDTVDDTLCIDVSFRKDADNDDDATNDPLFASVRTRDDAYWDGTEYQCPPASLQSASASHAAPSNPVHEALGPVHARRALDVAHGAVRDRVSGWTPGAPRVLTAISPRVDIGSLSGESDGFDYTGSSESVSAGAEVGSGSWQAGLVGSYTRTELHYRAVPALADRGYRSGEHTTEILSLHPFAAWHMPSGGSVWTSLGAGRGELRHRDDLGFPSLSHSDVRLRTYAAGASVPLADIMSGELEAEAGVESFDFEIEGGGRISSALPTLRGRDWRAGLTWSAPVRGAPSLSMAYRHLTGDGPEGGQLEARGSVSVDGVFDPRLTLTGSAEGSFGLGDDEHNSWGLSGGVRFAPGADRRGFGLKLDTRLVPVGDGGSPELGMQGEAGYGLWSGNLLGTIRPFAGLVRYSRDGSFRRSLGVDFRETPASRARLELYDQPRDRLRALRFDLRHRF